MKQAYHNPFDSLDEDRPQAPVFYTPQTREQKADARIRFLLQSGYTILPDGPTKNLRVNRKWIQGDTEAVRTGAKWLLFPDGGGSSIPATEVLLLDETATEIEEVVTTKQVQHGCRVVDEKQVARSAYMITTGRVAYRAA